LKTVGNREKEAMKADRNDAQINGYPITKSANWIPVIGHPCDCAPIMLQIRGRRTNHDQEFCYRYIYINNRDIILPPEIH